MKKKQLIFPIILILGLIILIISFFNLIPLKINNKNSVSPIDLSSPSIIVSEKTERSYDLVRIFFDMLSVKQTSAALTMMDATSTLSGQLEKKWADSIGTIDTLRRKSIEVYDRNNWSDSNHKYKVTLSIKLKTNIKSDWVEGENVRYIKIVKKNNDWKISSISTNP